MFTRILVRAAQPHACASGNVFRQLCSTTHLSAAFWGQHAGDNSEGTGDYRWADARCDENALGAEATAINLLNRAIIGVIVGMRIWDNVRKESLVALLPSRHRIWLCVPTPPRPIPPKDVVRVGRTRFPI